jgi:hypothetical protein
MRYKPKLGFTVKFYNKSLYDHFTKPTFRHISIGRFVIIYGVKPFFIIIWKIAPNYAAYDVIFKTGTLPKHGA